MNSKKMIVMLAITTMRSAAVMLRALDADDKGADDEAAEAVDFAVSRLEKWLIAAK